MARKQEGIRFEDADGVEHMLPSKFEVCGTCEGRGSHVNRNIDGHGITESEWNGPDWSEEEKDTYLSGGYDVTCEECHGARVVEAVDEARCDPALLKAYQDHEEQVARWDAEDRHTRYMESGGHDY